MDLYNMLDVASVTVHNSFNQPFFYSDDDKNQTLEWHDVIGAWHSFSP